MQATAPVLPAARGRILDAAEQLVADQGASSLTLDAVAQAAGVSTPRIDAFSRLEG